jgi:hypothetical protein
MIADLNEFDEQMEIVRTIRMWSNDEYSEILRGKHSPDAFPIQTDLKKGDVLSACDFQL